jgi:hypothetical protein
VLILANAASLDKLKTSLRNQKRGTLDLRTVDLTAPLSGNKYDLNKKMPNDALPFSTEGILNKVEVLAHLTQLDTTDTTTNDNFNCGGLVCVAAAIIGSEDGYSNLCHLLDTQFIKGQAKPDAEVVRIKAALEDHTAKYDDLSIAAEKLVRLYAGKPTGETALDIDLLADILHGANLKCPMTKATPTEAQLDGSFSPRHWKAWPFKIITKAPWAHFILFYRNAEGHMAIYDPFPMDHHGPVIDLHTTPGALREYARMTVPRPPAVGSAGWAPCSSEEIAEATLASVEDATQPLVDSMGTALPGESAWGADK